jgi:hypothetical protein
VQRTAGRLDRTATATANIEDIQWNIALNSRHVYTLSKIGHRQHNIDSRNTLSLYCILI